jgi:hypothetical protein
MILKKTILLFTLCCGLLALGAQNEEDGMIRAHLNGNLQLGIPLGLFNENLDRLGFGGGGILAFRLGETPLYAGLELSGMTYGGETQNFAINIVGFIDRYELRTTNNFFLGHALIRFMPDIDFPIKPYFDGMIGTKNLYTRTRLTNLDRQEDNTDSRVDQGDWAFSYGGAIGFQLDIFGTSNLVLDVRCAYLPGTNADYLVRRPEDNGIVYDDPLDAFDIRNSPTTILLPQIGITINIPSGFGEEEEEAEEPRIPIR